jgi:hypothetical protein
MNNQNCYSYSKNNPLYSELYSELFQIFQVDVIKLHREQKLPKSLQKVPQKIRFLPVTAILLQKDTHAQ